MAVLTLAHISVFSIAETAKKVNEAKMPPPPVSLTAAGIIGLLQAGNAHPTHVPRALTHSITPDSPVPAATAVVYTKAGFWDKDQPLVGHQAKLFEYQQAADASTRRRFFLLAGRASPAAAHGVQVLPPSGGLGRRKALRRKAAVLSCCWVLPLLLGAGLS